MFSIRSELMRTLLEPLKIIKSLKNMVETSERSSHNADQAFNTDASRCYLRYFSLLAFQNRGSVKCRTAFDVLQARRAARSKQWNIK